MVRLTEVMQLLKGAPQNTFLTVPEGASLKMPHS